jgi:hypothetical protein
LEVIFLPADKHLDILDVMKLPHPPKIIEIVFLDTLGSMLMIAAILTGWLPGPGGIPLFILGLSLLAINHAWAKRHILKIREYVKQIDKFLFERGPKVQASYDIVGSVTIAVVLIAIYRNPIRSVLMTGIVIIFMCLTLLVGNRGRYKRLTRKSTKR